MKKAVPSQGVTPTLVGDEALRHWQRRALARFLADAEPRVLDTSNRFVKAASELLRERGDLSFTIREVVTQSKMSVRDFYKTFASKDDLLLALFEEYCAGAAELQRACMTEPGDAVEQIRGYLAGAWVGKLRPAAARALATCGMTLSLTRPDDFVRALEPQVLALGEMVERGTATGQVRDDIGSSRLAEILLHASLAAAEETIVRPGNETFEAVWAFCLGGLRQQP